MKSKFLILFLSISISGFSQENVGNDSLKTVLFSFTPRTKKVQKINGLAIGLGYDLFEKNTIKKVNGLNIEVNPLVPLFILFDDPGRRGFAEQPTIKINGLSLGTGHSITQENIAFTGVAVALSNSGYSCNGISVNGFYNFSTKMNGLHVSGIANVCKNMNGLSVAFANSSEKLNGIQVGALNDADYFKGIQLGLYNHSTKYKGIQIGLVNKTKSQQGLQVGFWNINNKRSFPFLNW